MKYLFPILMLVTFVARAQNNNLEKFYQTADYTRVIELVSKNIGENKGSYEAFYYKGLAESALFKFNEASISFENALEFNPMDLNLNLLLAKSYENEGNLAKAISQYDKLIRIDTTYVPALSSLAKLYKNDKEYLKASDYYTKLISIDSTNGYFYSQLAYCCDKMGFKQPVIAYYEKAVELNPKDYKSVKSLINEIISQKYYDQATYYIDSFLVTRKDDLYLLKQKAYVSALNGRYLDAVSEFKYVTTLGDSSLFTCKYYGQSLYNNGQYDQAVFWLKKYLNKKPDDFQNQFIIGLAYQNDYQYEKSLKHLNVAMLLKFDRKMISRIFTEQARTQIMYGDYRGFRDSTPDKANILYQDANNNYLNALEINEFDWKIYKDLGLLYENKIKDMKLALYYYEKYYDELDPKKINEYKLDWIQKKIASLKEEVHFIGN